MLIINYCCLGSEVREKEKEEEVVIMKQPQFPL